MYSYIIGSKESPQLAQQIYTALTLFLELILDKSSIHKSFGHKYVVCFSKNDTRLSERNLSGFHVSLSILWKQTMTLNSVFSTYKGETYGYFTGHITKRY